ncbi:MAG: outer membrane protein assembly factor BamA [Alphaproteobacteria bacterium]|nr:outer membrane protein assembly factor BamA [Alphaproteobacteria bacterium]
MLSLNSTRLWRVGVLLALFGASPGYSQSDTSLISADPTTISAIVVDGTQRIEPETVRSYLFIHQGDPFDSERIDRSLKSLFATGLFADVVLHREGTRLVIKVVENPIINRIAFEGNKRIKEDALSKEIQLQPRIVYTRTKVQGDVQRIIELYRRRGRFAATVEPKVIQRNQNRVDLVFEINEGPPTYVRRINLVGNHEYSDSDLRDILATKEERWYRFLTQNDTYDPDRLTYDRELLRRFYLKHGYADFRVVSAVAELTPDRENFYVTITIEEGQRYHYGDVNVTTSLPKLKVADLVDSVTSEKGSWYNADEVEKSVQNLTDTAGTLGYAFAEVRPHVNRNREQHTVDITFDIVEGPRVYVERIDITGNLRTLDKVIRREFRMVEGDAFSSAKIRHARKRLEDLDFFEKVDITNGPSETAADRTVVKVNIQEKSTGDLSFGIGWSTTGGAMFQVGLRERNLLGTAQDLQLQATIGQKQSQVNLSYTEPYFLDRELAAGFDVFAVRTDLTSQSSYTETTVGGKLRTGFRYNDAWMQAFSYALKSDTVKNIQPGASIYILDEAGTTVTSSFGQSLTYDKRDSRINPTEGHVVRLSNDVAGAGGDERYLRTNLDAIKYFPLGDQWVLKVGGDAGYIFGLNQDVRITDRFFLGGETLRGFAVSGVSPRDKTTGDALGGNWVLNGTTEVNFPFGLPKEIGLTGHVFSDFGTIGNPDNVNTSQVNVSSSLRSTAGAGVTWKSPMGPVSIDLALPMTRESFDKTEFFRFNFGSRF